MKELPILFKPEMVQKILSGDKTQARRIIKGNTSVLLNIGLTPKYFMDSCNSEVRQYNVGDILWVRETWKPETGWEDIPPSKIPVGEPIRYFDDCLSHPEKYPMLDERSHDKKYDCSAWRPSIFMMRWMSRITLEITNVRIERIQSISEEDAREEGISSVTKDGELFKFGITDSDGLPGNDNFGWHWSEFELTAKNAFRKLWNSINEPRGFGWDKNPWVWVIEFKVK